MLADGDKGVRRRKFLTYRVPAHEEQRYMLTRFVG